LQSTNAEVGGIATTAEYDYDRAQTIAVGERMLEQAKRSALATVSFTARSLEYITGERPPIDYEDRAVGLISGAAARIADSYKDQMIERPQERTPALGVSFPLAQVLSRGSLKRFLAGEKVSLVIAPDPTSFQNQYCVMTRRLYLQSPRPVSNFLLSFAHQGQSLMRLKDGSFAMYTHATIPGNYQVGTVPHVIQNGELGRSERFFGVSPYGPWRLQLYASPGVAKQLADASIVFDVDGYNENFPSSA
jgi:hypothetical protein